MAIFKRNGEKLDYDQSQDLFLEKLYGSLAGRCLLKVLTQPVITELGGAFMNSSLSLNSPIYPLGICDTTPPNDNF